MLYICSYMYNLWTLIPYYTLIIIPSYYLLLTCLLLDWYTYLRSVFVYELVYVPSFVRMNEDIITRINTKLPS